MVTAERIRQPITLIGAPSTAGAYAPGQEETPRLLRDAGLVDRLRSAGVHVVDAGDTPFFRWAPDRSSPRAQHLGQVVATAQAVAAGTRDAVVRGARALVIGGDCTIATGVVAGVRASGFQPGLIYLDRHPDMNTPASVPDGALDWMGVAHLLGLPGAAPELVHAFGPEPVLNPADIVLLATDEAHHTPWERDQIAAGEIAAISWQEVAADPPAAATQALGRVGADGLVVHFDVDVLDFTDAPLSADIRRNTGITLDQAGEALATLLQDRRVRAVSLAELQPAHALAEASAVDRLIAVLVRALGD